MIRLLAAAAIAACLGTAAHADAFDNAWQCMHAAEAGVADADLPVLRCQTDTVEGTRSSHCEMAGDAANEAVLRTAHDGLVACFGAAAFDETGRNENPGEPGSWYVQGPTRCGLSDLFVGTYAVPDHDYKTGFLAYCDATP